MIPVHLAQITADGCSTGLIKRKAHQLFGGAVGISDVPLAIQRNNTFLNGVENRLHQPPLAGERQKMPLQAFRIQSIQMIYQLI